MALSPRDRRAVMILLPVLVVAVAGYILLSGQKDAATSGLPPGSSLGPQVSASPSVEPSPAPSPSPTEMLVFTGRDPFENPFSDASPVASSSPLPITSPTPSVSPAGSPPPTPTGGSSTTSGGHTVVLVDIFSSGTKAQVEVDGTVYTVGEGETFASTFKLVSISGTCASFLNGDSSFTLCETANK